MAATRVNESDDDELACAYYCANVPAAEAAAKPYRRRLYARAYQEKIMAFYRRHHIDRLVKMVVKPTGLNPSGRLSRIASAVLWRLLIPARRRGRRASQTRLIATFKLAAAQI